MLCKGPISPLLPQESPGKDTALGTANEQRILARLSQKLCKADTVFDLELGG